MIHIALHLLLPVFIALGFYRANWRRSTLILWAGMLIDLDHLLADPIYDPARCSIGFHALHSALPITLYAAALVHPRTRLLGLGLCLHILLDALDCAL